MAGRGVNPRDLLVCLGARKRLRITRQVVAPSSLNVFLRGQQFDIGRKARRCALIASNTGSSVPFILQFGFPNESSPRSGIGAWQLLAAEAR